MKLDKMVIALSIFVVATMGISPIFAADPTNTGTSHASMGVNDTISLLISGDVSWANLLADNIASTPQQTTITSQSNVPINVGVTAAPFATNMPLSALQVQAANGTYEPMNDTASVTAITAMPIPSVGSNTTHAVNLQAQVPFGVLTNSYSTTATWTASKTL